MDTISHLVTGAVIFWLGGKGLNYFFYLVREYEFDKVRRRIIGPHIKNRMDVLNAVEAYTLESWVPSFLPEYHRQKFMEGFISLTKLAQLRVTEPTPEGLVELVQKGMTSDEKPSA